MRRATKTLLIIDLALSIGAIVLGIILFAIYLSLANSMSKDVAGAANAIAFVYLFVFAGLGMLSTALVGRALHTLDDAFPSTGLGVALILFSFFFPAGILFIINANHTPSYSSYRPRLYSSYSNSSSGQSISKTTTSVITPTRKRVDPYKAIFKIEKLHELGIIDLKTKDKLLKKYKEKIDN